MKLFVVCRFVHWRGSFCCGSIFSSFWIKFENLSIEFSFRAICTFIGSCGQFWKLGIPQKKKKIQTAGGGGFMLANSDWPSVPALWLGHQTENHFCRKACRDSNFFSRAFSPLYSCVITTLVLNIQKITRSVLFCLSLPSEMCLEKICAKKRVNLDSRKRMQSCASEKFTMVLFLRSLAVNV